MYAYIHVCVHACMCVYMHVCMLLLFHVAVMLLLLLLLLFREPLDQLEGKAILEQMVYQ